MTLVALQLEFSAGSHSVVLTAGILGAFSGFLCCAKIQLISKLLIKVAKYIRKKFIFLFNAIYQILTVDLDFVLLNTQTQF